RTLSRTNLNRRKSRILRGRIAYPALSLLIILTMLVSPIHAWSADRPSRDNKASQWLYSYETPPIGNNPLGPVTDKSIPSPFSDSQISLATETLSYIHNYDAQDCTKLCHDKYTFRLMAFATSRSAHVMPAPTYHGYPDINQCTGTSPRSEEHTSELQSR